MIRCLPDLFKREYGITSVSDRIVTDHCQTRIGRNPHALPECFPIDKDMGQIQITPSLQNDQVHVLYFADESFQCHRPVFHKRRFVSGNNSSDGSAGLCHSPGIFTLPVNLKIMGIMFDHRCADPSR